MKVEFLTDGARLAVGILAGVAGLSALILRWRGGPRLRGGAATCAAAAIGAVVVLVIEQLVGFTVKSAAPDGVAFNEWRWVLRAPWGTLLQSVFLLIGVATVALSWLGTRRVRSPGRRALLVGLRAGAVAAALVLLFEPAVELRDVTREPNHVVILVDDSGSMSLAEKPGDPTRAERAARILAKSAATMDGWRGKHRVELMSFSHGLVAQSMNTVTAPLPTRADATRLRDALEEVRRRFEGQDLAGIVVLSDGVDTGAFAGGAEDGGSQAFLQGLGAPVHTVWTGRAGLLDRAIARVEADEFAFVRTVVKVGAVVRATGLPRRSLAVTLTRDGKVVQTRQVAVGGDNTEAHVEFAFTPERVGKYVYEVSVPEAEGERVLTNNRRAFVMRVIRDKVRVLQVAGRPSWDERWVRSLLEADPNVDLISFFILRTPDDLQPVPSAEMSLIPFPTEELFEQELGSFDVILLMNFEYAPYGIGPYLDNIRRFVDEGGSLAMIGGDLSFSSGGYWGTPVGEVLPVELSPRSGDADRLISTEMFAPKLTDEGQRHPITQLDFDPATSQKRWAALPELEGINVVEGARPGSTVLATHPRLTGRGGRKLPVLVVGEHEKGRTMALMTDSLWRWGFVAAGRSGQDASAFQTLWSNALRWLIRDPDLEYLHVESAQAEYVPGEAARVRVRFLGRDYRPAPEKKVKVVVERSGAKKPVRVAAQELVTDESGEAILDLGVVEPGSYRATATATLEPRTVTASDVFLAHGARVELERPEADPRLLQTLARLTEGRFMDGDGGLPSDLPFREPRVVRVDRMSDVELWSRPYLFWAALGLLGLEWALRRRSGHM